MLVFNYPGNATAILLVPGRRKVAAFVGALWFLLPAARGRVFLAHAALFASVTLWIFYSADIAVAFALGPLLLAALLPERKWGIGDDYDPASGVAR